jgi:hypothetical protein
MKVPQRTYSSLDRLLMPFGIGAKRLLTPLALVARSTKFLCGSAAVILVAVFSAYASRAHSFLIFPGLLVDSLCANRFSGGFGDWRDPILIVAGAWSFWITPLFIIWLLLRLSFRNDDGTVDQKNSTAKRIPFL